jgi:hypothetical protein
MTNHNPSAPISSQHEPAQKPRIQRLYAFLIAATVAFTFGLVIFAILGIQGAYPRPSDSSDAAETSNIVPIDDKNLYFSPYNWYSGDGYKQATAGGQYIKVAFRGTQLGLQVDTNRLGDTPPDNIIIHAYIDGVSSPISSDLSQVVDGQLLFTDLLTDTTHTAIIYLSSTEKYYNRWTDGAPDSLIVTGLIVSGGRTLKLVDTDVEPHLGGDILIYGDSITEGARVKLGAGPYISEYTYAAQLGQLLGREYGQVGFSGASWTHPTAGNIPKFFSTDSSEGSWSNYYQGQSRLTNGKFRDIPHSIFNNLGINYCSEIQSEPIYEWLLSARLASSPSTDIYMIVPFNFAAGYCGNGESNYHKGINKYLSAFPNDKHVFTINLGNAGYQAVLQNSNDALHPDAVGSKLLAGYVRDALTPLPATNVTIAYLGGGDFKLSWSANRRDNNGIPRLQEGYLVQYRESGTNDWLFYSSVSTSTTEVTFGNLATNTSYDFRVTSISTGLIDNSPSVELHDIISQY